MKCPNCGFESSTDFNFCTKCGAPANISFTPNPADSAPNYGNAPDSAPNYGNAPDSAPNYGNAPGYDYSNAPNYGNTPNYGGAPGYGAWAPNPATATLVAALRDPLFMAICILWTVSSAFSILSSTVNVIAILLTVFLWLTYSKARKGYADQQHLRSISGTVYANYVIYNVVSILLIVCGLVFGVAFNFLTALPEFIGEFESKFGEFYSEFYSGSSFGLESLPKELFSIIGWVVCFVFVVIAVIMLLFNILGMRKIHRFAKSIYQGISDPRIQPANPRGTKNWLIFFGVCSAISALSSLTASFSGGVATGCSAATAFIAAVLINKYFIVPMAQPQPQYPNT